MSENKLRRLTQYWIDYGPGVALRVAVGKLVLSATSPLIRSWTRPTLQELATLTASANSDPSQVLQSAFSSGIQVDPRFQSDFADAMERLRRAYSRADLSHPIGWSLGQGSSYLLYLLIRTVQPEYVLETGVANGHSTFLLLDALARNGRGRLTSIDVDQRAGALVRGMHDEIWDFRVLRGGGRRAEFQAIVHGLPRIDLFVHDSDHGYFWQMLELESVFKRTGGSSWILCDDVDYSQAFLDFCRKYMRPGHVLIEPGKVFGVVAPASEANRAR